MLGTINATRPRRRQPCGTKPLVSHDNFDVVTFVASGALRVTRRHRHQQPRPSDAFRFQRQPQPGSSLSISGRLCFQPYATNRLASNNPHSTRDKRKKPECRSAISRRTLYGSTGVTRLCNSLRVTRPHLLPVSRGSNFMGNNEPSSASNKRSQVP